MILKGIGTTDSTNAFKVTLTGKTNILLGVQGNGTGAFLFHVGRKYTTLSFKNIINQMAYPLYYKLGANNTAELIITNIGSWGELSGISFNGNAIAFAITSDSIDLSSYTKVVF